MDRTDADELDIEMPPVSVDNSRVNRYITPPACFTSGLASVISIFCIGLVSGVPGGLLLGATAVVLLQSLELLADNKPLMDLFEKEIPYTDQYITKNNQNYDIQISLFCVMFGVFSSVLSLAVGTYVGLATYSLVIQRKGEAASGKALAVAGSVCLMCVTATGCLLGFTLEGFLSMTLIVVSLWYLIQIEGISLFIAGLCFMSIRDSLCFYFISAHIFVYNTYSICFTCHTRLILAVVLIPMIVIAHRYNESCDLKTTTVTVIMMLTISDIYHIAGQQIVSLQSPTSTTTSSVVIEAIFVGVLASLMWTVTVGMSLFVKWQRGGAGKIFPTAAATGSAALAAIRLALHVLGPGPTIGALIGMAGAAGVSLAAAGAVTDQYRPEEGWHRLSGRLGVTVGAAVGAFLMSCSHSGLSAISIALCAATLPAGAFLKLWYLSTLTDCSCDMVFLVVIIFFTYRFFLFAIVGCVVGTCFLLDMLASYMYTSS